ncbi:MAG: cell wall-binding repeat-containing protein [Gracilibacteraceae bacterium]|jgi:putative cell wall-binding protein|nr:cell wall-binding repeat-containing protein [Gracilibacteraceae bacterium]
MRGKLILLLAALLCLLPVGPGAAATAAETPRTQSIYLSGTDYIDAAVAMARFEWTEAKTVILAPVAAASLIDVLIALPLSGQEKAPILLVDGTMLDYRVMVLLRDFGVERAILVGAVAPEIALHLESLFPAMEIEILRGKNRLETAARVNARLQAPYGSFVVGYGAVADAVSAASWAAAHGYMIQLANADGSFSGERYTGGYILGGPALVHDILGLERVYGPDRYATNQALLRALSYEYDKVYTVDGQALTHALLAASAACRTNSPVILTDRGAADIGAISPDARVFAVRTR